MAAQIGLMRQLLSACRSRRDAHGFSGLGWSEHIEGACGELAVAKHLDIHWWGGVDAFSEPDLPNLQVRTRSRHDYDLIVRETDSDMEVFVLVTGRCPQYKIRGWLRGRDAKRSEWLHSYSERPRAYFVPASQLKPVEDLRKFFPGPKVT